MHVIDAIVALLFNSCDEDMKALVKSKAPTVNERYKTCPVAVCLGDLVDAYHSYYWFKEAFDHVKTIPSKPDTMFVTIGNHDVFFNQWEHYLEYWPTAMYPLYLPG